MKNKIVGIFVCMLMIFSTTIPVIGIRNNEINNSQSNNLENKLGENLPLLINEDYEVIRDEYGVPHIYADAKEDLAFGMGYAQAEDRLWQIDLIRRETTGRLAEFDLATIEDDLFIRTIGNSKEEITSIYNNVSSPYKEMAAAFVAGINHYIDEAIADPDNRMPAEYIDRDLLPEYLTVEDSLTITIMALRLWGEAYTGEELFRLIDLVALIGKNGVRNGWKIFNDIYPIYDPGASTTINGNSSYPPQDIAEYPQLFNPFLIKLAKQITNKFEAFDNLAESLGLLNHFGSNAWVVAPEKSTTGNTLLLGGPQMGHSIPQQVVEIGLHGSDIDAVGVTLPGLGPSIVIGVSKWCSWSQTTGMSDLVDTYIERLHPLNKLKYKFDNQWHTMESRTETIYDSLAEPHSFDIHKTIHGNVIGSFWLPILGGFAITRKEPDWSQAHKTINAACSFTEAKNVTEFMEKVKDIPTSHNYLFSDRYGNIGYFHTGWYPIRPEKGILNRKIDPRLPLRGTGKEEWLGVLPSEENPQGINPPEGFYANWNNKPCCEWFYSEGNPYFQEGSFGIRVERIQELLKNDASITVDDMKDICKNVAYHEYIATMFIPFLREAINNIGGIPLEVKTAIENWDCCNHDEDLDGYYDNPGNAIFWEWFFEMANQSICDEIPNSIHSTWTDLGLYHRVLYGDNASLDLRYKKYLNGISRDKMIINVLNDTLIILENKYGTNNVSMWLQPDWMLTYNDPIFTEVGNLQSPEKLGYHLPYMDRGTYNQIIEMPNIAKNDPSDPPIGVNVLPCGQSGFVKYPDTPSPHAYDQLDLYLDWQFKPMLFNLSFS